MSAVETGYTVVNGKKKEYAIKQDFSGNVYYEELPKTHHEAIKEMTVEEMADFLVEVWLNDANIFPSDCNSMSPCYGECLKNTECIKRYLQEEIENND